MCEHQRIQTCLPDSTTLKNVSTVVLWNRNGGKSYSIHVISISVPHDSFIASVYSFTSSCSALLLQRSCSGHTGQSCVCLWGCVVLICACVVGGSARDYISRKYVQKKNSPGPAPKFSNILRGVRGSVNKLKYEGRASL